MEVVFQNQRYESDYEDVVPIFWNYDQNLLIGEASVTYENGNAIAEVALFEDLAPDWFIGMMHDCPNMWGITERNSDILMIGVVPPSETEITMLVLDKLAELKERNYA